MRSAKRAILQHNGVARSEQLWLFRLGSALLWRCVATGEVGDQQAWPLALGVLVQAVLSRGERCSEVQRLLHEVKGCRPSATCAATNRRPLPSRCCSGRRWRGKRTHSVEMPCRLVISHNHINLSSHNASHNSDLIGAGNTCKTQKITSGTGVPGDWDSMYHTSKTVRMEN